MASRSLGPVGLRVYNAFYWPYLALTCVLFFVPAVVIWALTLWDVKKRTLHAFTSFWGAHYLAWAPFASVRVECRERGLTAGPCIYVSNHQSMVDILAVFATYLPYRWVSKRANFFAPFLGWTMWLNRYVPLRRGHLPSIRRMLRRCQAELAAGNSLFVFPEGTRSPDGELRTFFRGAFWLATRQGVPIVPVVIEGTRDILPKASLLIRPQAVLVRVLPPLDARSYGQDDRRLRDQVRAVMAAELATIRSGFAAAAADAPFSARGVLASTPAHATARAHPAKAGDPRSA
ncbi:MAG TPA: lysophospholipid acyltransferase family protein [Polyangiaceae bacterium]|nr:lysophospholipid acyltransferase family protein [Polyangiaceae bacterium]